MAVLPMKSNNYVKDDFGEVIQQTLPIFLLLMYLVPVFRLISRIVTEKETKAREGMKMMGLTDFPYWLSWFVYYFLLMTIISLVSLLLVARNVFEFSDKGFIFLFFWLYGASMFGFALLVSSMFSRARVASISGSPILCIVVCRRRCFQQFRLGRCQERCLLASYRGYLSRL